MRHMINLILAIAFVFAQSASRAQAQTSFQDVHVYPRVKEEKNKTQENSVLLGNPAEKIVVRVEVVLVPTTITDSFNIAVPGLDKSDFTVYEDGKKQEITYFSSEDVATSVCVIYDVSGSMKEKNEKAKEAILEFFKTANPADEFCVITIADKPEVLVGFTNSIEDIQAKLVTLIPKGQTSLLDGIYLGIQKMNEAFHKRRAILIISDGGDNKSRYTESEIKSVIKEADVLIYAVGAVDPVPPTQEEIRGPGLLREITELTGGRAFFVNNIKDLEERILQVSAELRNLYILGYRPKNLSQDGKFKKIEVKIKRIDGLPPLNVYTKKGYYAPNTK